MKYYLLKLTHLLLPLFVIIIIISSDNLYSQETKIRVIKNNAVLRLSPNSDSLVIKELPAGALLIAEETIGEWVKVKLPPDKDGIIVTGYIHSSFVTFELKPSQPELEKKIELPARKSEAFIQWQNKLSSEKSKASSGLVIGISGAVVGIACGVLAATDKKEEVTITYSSITYDEKVKPGYLIGGGVGLLALVVGMVQHSRARNNINQLKIEGRVNGYITAGILPKYKAIGILVEISF